MRAQMTHNQISTISSELVAVKEAKAVLERRYGNVSFC